MGGGEGGIGGGIFYCCNLNLDTRHNLNGCTFEQKFGTFTQSLCFLVKIIFGKPKLLAFSESRFKLEFCE